jgi:iron(III) transport system substrate-binding protein
MKKAVFGFLVLMGALSLVAGSAGAAAGKPGWQVEWEKVAEGAKREGQVNVYMWGSTAVLDAGVFQKRYPDVKLFVVQGLGAQLQQRILSERRAGRFLADVVIHGANPNYTVFYPAKILEPINPALILPEVTDESKWWGGKHRYVDPEGEYVFVSLGTASRGGFSYNMNLVKNPKEFRSFWDFVNPKWKGKILAQDVRGNPGRARASLTLFYHHRELGPEFIRRLFGEMDATLFKDDRQGTDWLAVGKFSICFACDVRPARLQGLPVEDFGAMKEGQGLSPQGGTLVFVNRAPHPNAAKLFINWFLSREGQTTYQAAGQKAGDSTSNSLREDIPKDVLRSDARRVEGVHYFPLDRWDVLDLEPIYKVITDAVKQAGKQ